MRSQDDNHRSLHKMIANISDLIGGDFLVADDGTTFVTTDDGLSQVLPE